MGGIIPQTIVVLIGRKVVPFCGSFLASYMVTPKRKYYEAYG